MDRQRAVTIQKAIREAVETVCKANGVKVAKDSCSYSIAGLNLRCELNEVGTNGEDLAKKAEFERYADMLGVQKTDYGRIFYSGGKTFKLNGINPKRHKFPFSGVEVGTSKQYKFPREAVQSALGYEVQPTFAL